MGVCPTPGFYTAGDQTEGFVPGNSSTNLSYTSSLFGLHLYLTFSMCVFLFSTYTLVRFD